MTELPRDAEALIEVAAGVAHAGPVLWLTGAGISAESGVPTFRGTEGYWQVGSRNYHPQELATRAAFGVLPDDVWAWYLYRRGVCRAAEPNVAHRALADLEAAMGERFLLVTQNVDGLHLRAGSTLARTYQIHGNIDFMRCSRECTPEAVPLPEEIDVQWERGRTLQASEQARLACATCGARARPHVLWFDEVYDEVHFRFDSSLEAAMRTPLLVVVGTTGATNLPLHVGGLVARRRMPMFVINPEENPFTRMVDEARCGVFLEGTAGEWVPILARAVGERFGAALRLK
jgi:NAD-dependent deacetylase